MDWILIYLAGYINALVLIYIQNLRLQIQTNQKNEYALTTSLGFALFLSLLSWILVVIDIFATICTLFSAPKYNKLTTIQYIKKSFNGERI